ncbi:FAD-binding domain containing [Fusarium albosuccineum]|uniref:FAD-binding domain containing n=1 Tax=Fusarium albosuccineum TaxID=1237068 RepID=A0A8H4LFQ8_9HYPO|nr:FAD-binding domain containing [Fusarium albosuccineum]
MARDQPFKVIIVGGSVAGLSLANMLQANDIDFVVLEAYPSIAPQVGASIGLLPHGNRILDQLGLYDKILQLAPPVDTFTFRDPSGSPLTSYPDMDRNLIDRHGYPMMFLDRQTLLQVLYDNINDISKVMTNKRVMKVELNANTVTAVASDASTFEGDILIGADGVHSSVRGEMRRLAQDIQPSWFDKHEEEALPCVYSCIFGISRPCPGIVPGGLHCVFRSKSSYLITGGPNGRVYWFRFQKLPEQVHGSKIPRYSQCDLEEAVHQFSDDPILPGLTFSTLATSRITAVMTALPEYVYKKWYFDRIFLLGDSAHKLHPIGGHGGNAAIETAAALTNTLVRALERSSPRLSIATITAAFDHVQTLRRDRVIMAMNYSHSRQRTESLDSPLRRLLALHLLPRAREQDVTLSYSAQIPASEKLAMISLPQREKLVPYKDELMAEPKERGVIQFILIGIYLACSVMAFYSMWLSPASQELGHQLSKVLARGSFTDESLTPLKKTYTGIPFVDEHLALMAAAFVPGFRNWNHGLGRLQMYLLGHLLQPIAIITTESFRGRFATSILAFPTIWFVTFQIIGIGVVLPWYCIVYTGMSNVESHWWPLRRPVPIRFAKVILPTSLLGYALPTVLTFVPWGDLDQVQTLASAWQFSPMLVPFLTWSFGSLLGPKAGASQSKDGQLVADVPPLRQLYVVIGCLGCILHWYTIVQIALVPEPWQVFKSFCSPNSWTVPADLEEGLAGFFCADLWGYCLTSYVWCVSAIWDLKRVGRTRVGILRAAITIMIAYIFLGPGAAIAGVWSFREDAMMFPLLPPNTKLHKE